MFWSHAGQKHQLVARWSKRSIRNFRPWGAKQWDKILGRNFTDHWCKFPKRVQSAGVALCNQSAGMALYTLQSATAAYRTRLVKIENFDQEKVFLFGPLLQCSPFGIFYAFWAPHGRKLRISLFEYRATSWCF